MKDGWYSGTLSHGRHQTKYQFTHRVHYYLWNLGKKVSLGSLRSLNEIDFLRDYKGESLGARYHALGTAYDIDLHGFHPLILSMPRFMGYGMNPLSLHFLVNQQQMYIVAEVSNTPWDERHEYVFRVDSSKDRIKFSHPKDFHVSPFLPLSLIYDWEIELSENNISVGIRVRDNESEKFWAFLKLRHRENAPWSLGPVATMALIYYHAAVLKSKGQTYVPHTKVERRREVIDQR